MARTAQARVWRSTQTSPNSGTLRDLATTYGTAPNNTTTAVFPTAGASGFRFSPNTTGTALAPPAVDTAPAGVGWRDTAAESVEPLTYAAGDWTLRVRLNKTVMTVNSSVTVRVTAIVYRVGGSSAEVGRVVFADTALATVGAPVSVSGSFTTGAPTSLGAGDKIQVEVYVQNTLLGVPAAAAVGYTVALVTDETSANGGTAVTAQPSYVINYARAVSDNAGASDAVTRQLTLARSLADAAAAADAVTRTVTFPRSLADSAPASDALLRTVTFPRATADAASATDTLTRALTLGRSLSDNAGASDAVTRQLTYVRGMADDIGPTGGGGGGPVTPEEIEAIATAAADRVWDELTSELRVAGSYGALVRADLDATTSSRSSQASVDALGSVLVALVDDLETRLSGARALLLDNLALLDVAVSTRATPADVDVDVTLTAPIDAVVEVS